MHKTVQSPYLIQRGKIRDSNKTQKLSSAVAMDYMGSSEFEWGALPNALRQMHKDKENYRLTREDRISNQNETVLFVHHPFNADEYEKYFSYLLALRQGTPVVHTKEMHCFSSVEDLPQSLRDRCDFWWDITNNVMFTFDAVFAKLLPDVLQQSWSYMKL